MFEHGAVFRIAPSDAPDYSSRLLDRWKADLEDSGFDVTVNGNQIEFKAPLFSYRGAKIRQLGNGGLEIHIERGSPSVSYSFSYKRNFILNLTIIALISLALLVFNEPNPMLVLFIIAVLAISSLGYPRLIRWYADAFEDHLVDTAREVASAPNQRPIPGS